MNDDLHRLLLKSDRPPSYAGDVLYEGQDFDRDDAVARAQRVRKELSRKFRRYFSLSDDQQDAYFWGDIAEPLGEQMPVRRPVQSDSRSAAILPGPGLYRVTNH